MNDFPRGIDALEVIGPEFDNMTVFERHRLRKEIPRSAKALMHVVRDLNKMVDEGLMKVERIGGSGEPQKPLEINPDFAHAVEFILEDFKPTQDEVSCVMALFERQGMFG